MNQLILPIIMILLCIIALIAMIFFMNKGSQKNKNKNNEKKEQLKQTAQDFVNVKDIKDIFLYTRDHHLISYIKVHAISFDLLTRGEQKALARRLTEEFSEILVDNFNPFNFLAVSRPVDITPLITEYSELLSSTSNTIQKEILRNEIKIISDFSLSGEVVQREFYYKIWEKENEYAETELRKRVQDLANRIDSAGIICEVLKESEIIKLCNLVNNPAFAAIEDTNVEVTIPLIHVA
ncbi:hypothetical protein [Anaeromicropila herbilytica]|uniref:Uncharacterized protein n=1 Tax=Anaeromicropila herbilytica TaxID=2785025 RepID=A0A7R7ID10_9FIRM|nr:hypothetical protein [Anaeromicropila herbilytica]BCN29543.1 hypothetical protein bsdtb5_08380 [Anaeromicropila herbilytica]